MNDYLRAVTLGAFTWRNEERIAMLFECMRGAGGKWLALHFMLLSVCLNFPIIFAMARLSPFELFGRLYGEDFMDTMPMFADAYLTPGYGTPDPGDFNLLMLENDYGRTILLPILGAAFFLTLVIQAVFYLSAVFFLRISRMNIAPISFRDRMGLALYSSTLPVLLASLFGMFLPTVHIIIYYFAIIFIVFQRSSL
ncbi:MAG: hypothetical protein FWD88_07690 [Treponema sp.]|nr:hypothetical protein [Treponema sp.]